MTHRIPGMLLAAIILASGTSAWACFNDTGSEAAEREFRSRYDRPVPTVRTGQISAAAMATMGAGVLLNVVAIGLLVRRRPAKPKGVGAATQTHGEVRP